MSKSSKPVFHYLKDTDLTPKQILEVLELAAKIKKSSKNYQNILKNKTVALLFEKLSLRTKFTLQIGINQMGGYSVINEGKIPDREPVKDVARNLERWADAIVARVYSQDILEEIAQNSSVPVVNALSNLYHPCQILADMLTLKEHFGKLRGIKIAFVGDGNNVVNSLMITCASLGLNFSIATPKDYEPHKDIVNQSIKLSKSFKTSILVTNNISQAIKGANVIYTDTWISMGEEHEADVRREAFKNFRVDEKMFRLAAKGAVFMHCLPKHPNEEVSDEVFESKRSLVFEQAENRLHTIKALLLYLLKINHKV